MRNPLFESLYNQARYYQIVEKEPQQKQAPKDKDVINYLGVIGTKMVSSFLQAIGTYPVTDYYKKFSREIPGKIRSWASEINSTGLKGTGQQLEKLLDKVREDLQKFWDGSKKEDPKYTEYLKTWAEDIQKGLNSFKRAATLLMDYYKDRAIAMEEDDYKILPDALNNIADLKQKELDDYDAIYGNISTSYKFSDNSSHLIEKIQKLPFLINFTEYNSLRLNEGEKGRAMKKAKSIIRDCKDLASQCATLATTIRSREEGGHSTEGEPVYNSSKMLNDFEKIGAKLKDILEDLEDKSKRELVDMDLKDYEAKYNNLKSSFDKLSANYNDNYKDESANVSSVEAISVNPKGKEVEEWLNKGEQFFSGLKDQAQLATNQVKSIKEEPKEEEPKKEEPKKEEGTPGKQIPEMAVDSKSLYFKKKNGKWGQKKSDKVKEFQETVIEKYKNSDVAKEPEYQTLKRLMGDGKGGYFGKATRELILFLEGGLNLPATDGNKIYKELVDAINKDLVKESFRFSYYPYIAEGFDLEAAKKRKAGAKSSSSSSTKSTASDKSTASNKSTGSAKEASVDPKKQSTSTSIFSCIKNMDKYKDVKIENGKAIWTAGSGNTHTFNSDYTYTFYWKKEDKKMDGKWECLGNDWKATTTEDKDYYLGSVSDWKSNLDKDAANKAAQKKKAEQELSKKGYEIAKKILIAISGTTEDEVEVYRIFREEMKTLDLYNATKNAWNSWWPTPQELRWKEAYWKSKSVDEITKSMNKKPGKSGYGFEGVFRAYFNDSEIGRLNAYIPAGAPKV